jgi:hypothetical protein
VFHVFAPQHGEVLHDDISQITLARGNTLSEHSTSHPKLSRLLRVRLDTMNPGVAHFLAQDGEPIHVGQQGFAHKVVKRGRDNGRPAR